MIFEELPDFQKEKKRLLKRFRSIDDDIQTIKQVLNIRPEESPPFSVLIDGLGLTTPVIKVKKFACKSLKGKGVKSGIRLIYAYIPDEEKIIFIELYYKNDKDCEDRQRIIQHFK